MAYGLYIAEVRYTAPMHRRGVARAPLSRKKNCKAADFNSVYHLLEERASFQSSRCWAGIIMLRTGFEWVGCWLKQLVETRNILFRIWNKYQIPATQ